MIVADYWLIKAVLLAGMLLLTWLIIRPVRSQEHLAMRRLGMILAIVFAAFAVLFPALLNRVADVLGVEQGINMLLYVLVLAFFAQVATAYRRDITTQKRLTELSRSVALTSVRPPGDTTPPAPGASEGPAGPS